jgi:hypothetical protein
MKSRRMVEKKKHLHNSIFQEVMPPKNFLIPVSLDLKETCHFGAFCFSSAQRGRISFRPVAKDRRLLPAKPSFSARNFSTSSV